MLEFTTAQVLVFTLNNNNNNNTVNRQNLHDIMITSIPICRQHFQCICYCSSGQGGVIYQLQIDASPHIRNISPISPISSMLWWRHHRTVVSSEQTVCLYPPVLTAL